MFFDPEAAKSRVTEAWVRDLWERYPCVKLDNGNIRTGAVRLSFPHLLEPFKDKDEPEKTPKYMTTCLFPAGADLSVLKEEAQAVALAKWRDAGQPTGPTLHTPFRDQKDKSAKYSGYVPGSVFITASGERKAPVVDLNLAPVTESSKIYPGVWAFVTVRCFDFDVKKKKGVSFGLQSVMIIADDENLGGGGSDPVADFAGVNIEQTVNPASLF
jgi:hypothetical protein